MALKSGFYNAMNVNGEYDRKYSGDDYTNIFSAYIKDGVRRSGLDDLRVVANGRTITVKRGYAVCGGRWVHLDAEQTVGTVTAPVGDYSRVDAVILRVDANEATRAASLLIRTGTAGSNPKAPAKDTTTGVTELILATIRIAPSASTVTLTDTRADATYCGWVTTPVGYDDYFKSLDSRFETWFDEKKDTLSSVTLFKQYAWRTVLSENAYRVTFEIPQYDPTGVDIVHVYVNGLLEIEGADYTLSGSTITFGVGGGGMMGEKIAGTEIVVIVYKSIDGTGLGSVSDEITVMQNQVAGLVKDTTNNYICNGVNDNVAISEIVAEYNAGTGRFAGWLPNAQLKINVYGEFGATSAVGGSGNIASPYKWFNVGGTTGSDKRVIIDFSNCPRIGITPAGNTYNTIFAGVNFEIIGANLDVYCGDNGCYVDVFDGVHNISARDSKFSVIITEGVCLAHAGNFDNCECLASSLNGYAYCFMPAADYNPVIVNGGKYRAYTANSAASSVVLEITNLSQYAAAFVTSINCPTVERAGFRQTHCISISNGVFVANGVITALPIIHTGGTAVINGHVAISRT